MIEAPGYGPNLRGVDRRCRPAGDRIGRPYVKFNRGINNIEYCNAKVKSAYEK